MNNPLSIKYLLQYYCYYKTYFDQAVLDNSNEWLQLSNSYWEYICDLPFQDTRFIQEHEQRLAAFFEVCKKELKKRFSPPWKFEFYRFLGYYEYNKIDTFPLTTLHRFPQVYFMNHALWHDFDVLFLILSKIWKTRWKPYEIKKPKYVYLLNTTWTV